MSGGTIPGFPSSWPPAPNLTFGAGSALPGWEAEDFINTIRTGSTPEAMKLRAGYMPWGSYKFMNDDELGQFGFIYSLCQNGSMEIDELQDLSSCTLFVYDDFYRSLLIYLSHVTG